MASAESHHIIHVAIVYRNAKAYAPNGSHIGLGVNAMHTVRSLVSAGVSCSGHAVYEMPDLLKTLDTIPADSVVVIEALWLNTENVYKVIYLHPAKTFVVRCHSQVGFLQVEPGAVQLVREQVAIQDHDYRFHLAGNSTRFTEFVRQGYRCPCIYLPNLYPTDRAFRKPTTPIPSRTLRLGSFGALRLLKMHLTAAAAALMAANQLGRDLEFHMTVGRTEHGGSVLASIRNLYASLPGATLVEHPWACWSEFRRLVAHMDVCLQVSATESFNLVTADAVAEGTPCVVGPAIDWVPPSWVADIDDPEDIARKVVHLTSDSRAAELGISTLTKYTADGVRTWKEFLASLPQVA